MLKLQKALHGVLQRRKANPHSPEKKIAASFPTGFLFCELFYEILGMISILSIEENVFLVDWI
jgi:hypothetical protein